MVLCMAVFALFDSSSSLVPLSPPLPLFFIFRLLPFQVVSAFQAGLARSVS
jgi:hypothetical protein